jgi:anti-sigma28 factor (negative regulator of flagellin synthesis)
MKIDQRSLDPAGASQLGKAQETSSVGSGGRGGARTNADADLVHLSDLSGLLLGAAGAEPERAARVDRLAAEYRSGNYNVDALELSGRMIDEHTRHVY